jgi:hypothetical protein
MMSLTAVCVPELGERGCVLMISLTVECVQTVDLIVELGAAHICGEIHTSGLQNIWVACLPAITESESTGYAILLYSVKYNQTRGYFVNSSIL